MKKIKYKVVSGRDDEKRIPSRILEEMIQKEVKQGHRAIEVDAFGQHGIGGRLWQEGSDIIKIRIRGQAGQRAGSLGCPNTEIEILGPVSDDVGWLNAGAQITVHGNASNGVMNGAAQGKVFIGGNIGARGMTMTKHNPRFDPPELWVLGSCGDYFGEFMAGGIAVVCGFDKQSHENTLGYRPLVGMVGGKVFFRGDGSDYSQKDARLLTISDEEWDWLYLNLGAFLDKVGKTALFDSLSKRSEWQILKARSPMDKMTGPGLSSMAAFRQDVWDRELGRGGLNWRSAAAGPGNHSFDHQRGTAAYGAGVGTCRVQSSLPGQLPHRHSCSGPLASHSQRSHGRSRIHGFEIYAVSGHGVRISVPQPLHGFLHEKSAVHDPCECPVAGTGR